MKKIRLLLLKSSLTFPHSLGGYSGARVVWPHPPVPQPPRLEMNKHIVIVVTSQRPLSPVYQPRRLVKDHLTRPQDDLVILAAVVLDEERPVLLDLLVHVDDGGDHVGAQLVHVGQKGGHVPVSPDPVN